MTSEALLIPMVASFLLGVLIGIAVVGYYAKKKIEKMKPSGIGDAMEDAMSMMGEMLDEEEEEEDE